MRVALLVSPDSGTGGGPAAADALHSALLGHEVTRLAGVSREAVLRAAREAVATGTDVLVVVGGDGTLHLALQAVAGTRTALAILATGTGNDLATALGVPLGVDELAAALTGPAVPVDAVRVGDQWFGCILGTGFDALVNERANRMRWPRGRRRYDLAVLAEVGRLRAHPVGLVLDGVRHDVEAVLIALGNAPTYGGGMRMCPGADLTDGLLEVVVVGRMGRLRLLRLFPRLFRGTHVSDPRVTVHRAREVQLLGDLPVYADGEPFGHLPLTATVVPGALRVVGARLG